MSSPETLLGFLSLGLSLAIVWKQSRARACDRHNRLAGVLAMLLAAGCLVVGIALLVGVTP